MRLSLEIMNNVLVPNTKRYVKLCGISVCQVNGQNVVKVGHRQVVNMIRQGGNSLMVKVVMVARNPELEDTVRKRGKPLYVTSLMCLRYDDKADCMFTSP